LQIWDVTTASAAPFRPVVVLGSGSDSSAFVGHRDTVSCIATLPDGRVATAGYDDVIILWRLFADAGPVGSPSTYLPVDSNVSAVVSAVLRNPNAPTTGGASTVGDVTAIVVLPRFGHAGLPVLVSACRDGGVQLWNVTTGSLIASLPRAMSGALGVLAVAVTKNGALMTASATGFLTVWDSVTLTARATVATNSGNPALNRTRVTCVALLRDGTVVTGGGDGRVVVWEMGLSG
jgi:WD40 repeat protein